MTTQVEMAQRFQSLHVPGGPLVLYNIWDAGSAKAVANAGAKAIATSSWAVAAAKGYADGEQLTLEHMLPVVERIVSCVDLPVTVDFEGGYAADPDGIYENVTRLLKLGVIGLNFEDQVVDGSGLYGIEEHVQRLAAVRRAADDLGVPAFINARTDVFLKAAPDADHAELLGDALAREAAYAKAGADGFFVPGLFDDDLLRQVCQKASLPINVMIMDMQADIGKVAGLGVSRISFGPEPYISLSNSLESAAKAIIGA
ncbi:isocitrate lyase/PEP mutase family protein [Pseudaestuariivita rosea]|uniref:isocitrate lyase/PEP mutase family protein n=1 Tax=Pseudaestuariivita rosea TaxID=2763263 RepID=UPI001ABB1AB9|nr:isocitrate lyase/phosphoenolpyruvate mutase family protein [Pseudaestuariivita rosea]